MSKKKNATNIFSNPLDPVQLMAMATVVARELYAELPDDDCAGTASSLTDEIAIFLDEDEIKQAYEMADRFQDS